MYYCDRFKGKDITDTRDQIASEITNNKIDNLKVTNEMICFAYQPGCSHKSHRERTRVLLNPKECEQQNLEDYIYYMADIISHNTLASFFYRSDVYGSEARSVFTRRLDNLIENLKPYCGFKECDDLIGNLGMSSIIIAYLYANDFNSYEMLDLFLSDPDLYYEKIKKRFPDWIIDRLYLNEIETFPYLEIYEDLEKILFGTEQIKIIK